YRLNVMNIKTIPLKDRKEDIEILAKYFVNNLNIKNMDKCKLIKKDYINQLKKHDWPGNIRELRNVIERDYYSSENDMIYMQYSENDSIIESSFNNEESKDLDKILPIDVLEKESIIKAINLCEGNIVKSAEMLGISRATIYRKIKKYNIKNV
ncbi:MAG TPA: sigma-54-dependent Fis family transcriptional regulator, partial [Clostridium sp.]|nr:sigma-54-dependent Fis family transcriptional regulator [Clostridium sp.]